MLRYKDKILPNLGVFYRYKNSVDVFVEDSNDEEFYKVLINRIFDRVGLGAHKLIALGGKKEVLSACKADQSKRKAKRIYIVDGDLELINGTNDNGLKHLFILKRYCIENYLMQEDALIEIIHDYVIKDKRELTKIFSFKNWLKGLSNDLVELFLHYAICKKYIPMEPTISLGIFNICCQDKGVTTLHHKKCRERIEDLKNKIISEVSEEQYNDEIYALRQQWPASVDSLLKIVSGKDYIIPLVQCRFKKFKNARGLNITRETLRLRLAKLVELQELSEIREFI